MVYWPLHACSGVGFLTRESPLLDVPSDSSPWRPRFTNGKIESMASFSNPPILQSYFRYGRSNVAIPRKIEMPMTS
jgi:hypothetical protein